MLPSNMTPDEYFRIHGTLPPAVIDSLLDANACIEFLPGVQAQIDEARGCFPMEDVGQDTVLALQALRKITSGGTRDRIAEILAGLEEELAEIRGNAEYGADELRKASASLKEGFIDN